MQESWREKVKQVKNFKMLCSSIVKITWTISKKKSVKEPVEYESCRHELWPEEVTPEAQDNAKGKEIEVDNDYPMFGVRKNSLENDPSKEKYSNVVEKVTAV